MLGKKVPEKFQGEPFIYFIIETPFRNRYKIGLTESKTSNRIVNLQTGSSDELTYDFIIPVGNFIKLSFVERLFHEFYAEKRRYINGKPTEWFNLTTMEAHVSNNSFIYYKNLYLVDKIVDFECFREVLSSNRSLLVPKVIKPKPFVLQPTSKFPDRRKIQVKTKVFTPAVIDLTVDDDGIKPIQKREFILNLNKRTCTNQMIVDTLPNAIYSINDITQEIENMTFRMKNLSLK